MVGFRQCLVLHLSCWSSLKISDCVKAQMELWRTGLTPGCDSKGECPTGTHTHTKQNAWYILIYSFMCVHSTLVSMFHISCFHLKKPVGLAHLLSHVCTSSIPSAERRAILCALKMAADMKPWEEGGDKSERWRERYVVDLFIKPALLRMFLLLKGFLISDFASASFSPQSVSSLFLWGRRILISERKKERKNRGWEDAVVLLGSGHWESACDGRLCAPPLPGAPIDTNSEQ